MGVPKEKQALVKSIVDRREALRAAIALAQEGDIVVATGKGSEVWIHVTRGKTLPWDERREVETILQSITPRF
jgi:UDP-N-acetylmuramoyl-L-alanyl-D-glutamate--2,6-diaminopimelate ligase